jgi:hypothetical protein
MKRGPWTPVAVDFLLALSLLLALAAFLVASWPG